MIVIPTGTDAPIYHWPYATVALIVLNVGLFFAVPPVAGTVRLDGNDKVIEDVETVSNFERYALAVGDGRLHSSAAWVLTRCRARSSDPWRGSAGPCRILRNSEFSLVNWSGQLPWQGCATASSAVSPGRQFLTRPSSWLLPATR